MSDAVSSDRRSKVLGYKLTPGSFATTTPNLPQRMAILAEANNAVQSDFTENEPVVVNDAIEAAKIFGWGSPIYQIMRILYPASGSGVGSVETVIYPQKEASSATAKTVNVEPSGTPTRNKTHTVVINNRRGVAGGRYDFTVTTSDSAADVAQKIVDVVNNVLAAPTSASLDTSVTTNESALLETKWKGLTADDLTVEIDTNGDDAGMTYAVTDEQAGAGTPAIQGALNNFQEEWNTIVLNSYGDPVLTTLEDFNGVPDPDNPTGRYTGTVFMPFVALFGDTSPDGQYDFSSRKDQVTNVVCVAPNSDYFPFEVAASYAAILGPQAQDRPHEDISGQKLPDLEAPQDIGDYSDYNKRDALVKRGYSTVVRRAGSYEVNDFVTTYHPDGVIYPQWAYVRSLVIDWNIKFSHRLLQEIHLRDKVIADNDAQVSAPNVIKPKGWEQILKSAADDWTDRALIATPGFTKESISVQIDGTNPDRINDEFSYQRTGYHRIGATTVKAGFNFGE